MTEKDEEKIPDLADEEWQRVKEIGEVFDGVIDYQKTPTEKAKVRVKFKVPSGSEMEALEASCQRETKTGIEVTDFKKYQRALVSRVFNLDGSTLETIWEKKPADLRAQMIKFALRMTGASLKEDDIQKEKN